MSDEATTAIKLPRLYPKQRAAIFAPERNVIIEASTKSGKTVGCLVWLLAEVVKLGRPGREFWWISMTYPIAKIAYRRMYRMFARADPDRSEWTCNESELFIELSNGARIWFKGGDRPDTLYGEDVWGCVIDEASRCKEESWHAVRSTLTKTRGRLRIIGNVRGRSNWAYKRGVAAKQGEPGWAYFKLTAWDAVEGGVLDRAEIESAQRDLGPDVFKQLYLAEAADDGANPFGLDAIARCARDTLADGPAVCYGVDLGKAVDYTVIIGLNRLGEVCEFHRFRKPWGETEKFILDSIGQAPTLVDSTGVGAPIVESMTATRENVEGYLFTNDSKQQLMGQLARAIHKSDISFPRGPIVDELEIFEYEYKGMRVVYSAPGELHDDCVCALALAVTMFTRASVEQEIFVI